mmetsp:Transcript_31398/g.121370  ORF Transcript_31398/g.121370 Transcript_31398/m.121370 type:complete len:210 (-) Transcript_31398:68-697(-)
MALLIMFQTGSAQEIPASIPFLKPVSAAMHVLVTKSSRFFWETSPSLSIAISHIDCTSDLRPIQPKREFTVTSADFLISSRIISFTSKATIGVRIWASLVCPCSSSKLSTGFFTSDNLNATSKARRVRDSHCSRFAGTTSRTFAQIAKHSSCNNFNLLLLISSQHISIPSLTLSFPKFIKASAPTSQSGSRQLNAKSFSRSTILTTKTC